MSGFEGVWTEKGVEALCLFPVSLIYAGGWIAYEAIYKFGWKTAAAPHRSIITIGNLIAGGSGKTPTTIYVASLLRQLGSDPVISISGYGSPASADAKLAPEGELSAREWGDEAAMVRWMFPDQALVVGRDRVMAAQLVHQAFPQRVMLMDDGFQHLRLEQPATIVLDPPPPNDFCLPAGPYREPRGLGRSRARLLLPSDRFAWNRSKTLFRQVLGQQVDIKVQGANVLCAVARPYRLIHSLRNEGIETNVVRVLPDHDPLTRGTLLDDFDPAVPLIVTAKDWVKLRERNDIEGRTVIACWYEAAVHPEEEFLECLREILNEFGQEADS